MRDYVRGGALTETTLLILLAMYKANHGYGIMQEIEKLTKGRVALGAGTLYGALRTLVDKGWIEALDEDEGGAGKRQYLITALGKEIVHKEVNRLQELLLLAAGIIKEESQ